MSHDIASSVALLDSWRAAQASQDTPPSARLSEAEMDALIQADLDRLNAEQESRWQPGGLYYVGKGASGREREAQANPLTLCAITAEELSAARITPRVILRDLLFADVRIRIAAGGTGKTTLALYEMATLALGRSLWGRTPAHPIRSALVTREDSREILVARLREICRSMSLTGAELAAVMANVTIVDVSGINFRLAAIVDDVVVPHTVNLEFMVECLEPWRPDWLIFDPLVSFGVGETRINDSEQGTVEAFRVLRNRLDCCVEGVHHMGKANSRDKVLDQYASRGGSALPDGSRMVCVMQPLDASEWHAATGVPFGAGETGFVMALPKLSFARKPDPIFVCRDGYGFSEVIVTKRTPEQEDAAIQAQVLQFISHEYSQGLKYSGKDLEDSAKKMNLSRQQIRSAVTSLKVSGRVIYHEVRGKSGSHYEPLTLADDDGDTPADEHENEGNE